MIGNIAKEGQISTSRPQELIRKLFEANESNVIPYQALDSLGGAPDLEARTPRAADRSSLRYPSDLTNAEWELVVPMIPPARHGGHRRSVNVREDAERDLLHSTDSVAMEGLA